MPDAGSWCGEKKKGSHMAALLFSRGDNAVRDAGLWMSRLLFMRAESADEVHGIIRRMSAERSANRARFAVRLPVAEKLATPVAHVRAFTVGAGHCTLKEAAVLRSDRGPFPSSTYQLPIHRPLQNW